mmetsp:Transcript_41072/g.116278  ORF Transcript_41072/g.116278 Transcript_41072/m.116278 type:complete len:343 (+) Transcript_41072:212-1240(+)
MDRHVLVAVGPRLLVRHAEGVPELVHRRAQGGAARRVELELLRVPLPDLAHVGVATGVPLGHDEDRGARRALLLRPGAVGGPLQPAHVLEDQAGQRAAELLGRDGEEVPDVRRDVGREAVLHVPPGPRPPGADELAGGGVRTPLEEQGLLRVHGDHVALHGPLGHLLAPDAGRRRHVRGRDLVAVGERRLRRLVLQGADLDVLDGGGPALAFHQRLQGEGAADQRRERLLGGLREVRVAAAPHRDRGLAQADERLGGVVPHLHDLGVQVRHVESVDRLPAGHPHLGSLAPAPLRRGPLGARRAAPFHLDHARARLRVGIRVCARACLLLGISAMQRQCESGE